MKILYLHDGSYDVVSIALKRGFEVVSFNIEDFITLGILLIILMFYLLIYLVKYQGH